MTKTIKETLQDLENNPVASIDYSKKEIQVHRKWSNSEIYYLLKSENNKFNFHESKRKEIANITSSIFLEEKITA